ncbi:MULTISPECIES: 4a-hydroxytetrahydrobiopterin dehydratase [Glycomyces]|uniref:Putative pterin-4-alpha-carbinolamine dehydratase n=2 Tax=Glycomyces TaxID=58113 RepID=A0A9X3PKQ1_9ACTN|nr:4a-hydroxytetrahydrobiopterin dehydratase [Glycomyces lechevalierae]MDA1387291.1 4a-hydroxytetrahydrobiopterin dehydratase [Glycomyces lechevalierae]MDR7340042.1 4a-hydroxytetrahydrobiopterin dehydratase [Glycomyces lechevalierae]
MSDQPLTDAEIELALSELPGWTLVGDRLEQTWTFGGHLQALAAATAVGFLNEQRGHHADLTVNYDKLRVSTTTHSAGNKVSAKDTDLARAVGELLE